MSQKRPTIEDVAAAAGVSRGTVSRVLNGGLHVSPSALRAVNQAIKRTGYTVNHHVRSLITRRSGAVAFILSGRQECLSTDPNTLVLVQGCARALAQYDIGLFVCVAFTDAERAQLTRFVTGGHVDAALVASAPAGDSIIDHLIASDVALGAIGVPLGRESSVAYVSVDDRRGARQMVSRLKSLGRSRIATIAGPLDMPGGLQRLQGYRDEAGCDLVAQGDYSQKSGEQAMTSLLERAPDLDAVFVASDVMALGALAALHRAGRRVPEDVAVGGFDDSAAAISARPALTTIRQPWRQISSEMVRLLLSLIDGEPHAAVILPTELVVRETA
jgi:DNA-binding LacI/PurR family transcriptional regulator